ncbi:MAG: curli production assembly/transport component CsgG [Micavibrio aeruginosavorus]|nr:curli production assembly/transport component CsgG [Micavibrio aeruginosavorus]
MKRRTILTLAAQALLLTGCAMTGQKTTDAGVSPSFNFPVTNNDTPYSQCLTHLAGINAINLPTFAVGEVADKTGQVNYDDNGHALTQGVSEMVISALAKTKKAYLVERLDLRIPLAEVKLSEQGKLNRNIQDYGKMPASDFIVLGALTELNYNIVSGGSQLFVKGIGGGARMVVINVALDLRVVDSKTFRVRYVSSLQKQIYGYEVEANVFRFFGNTLIEFDAGMIRNDPVQLGVRSVVEMAIYQIMTDFIGLPQEMSCSLVETDTMANYLEQLSPADKPAKMPVKESSDMTAVKPVEKAQVKTSTKGERNDDFNS